MEIYMDETPIAVPTAACMRAQTENAFDNTYLGRLPLAMAYVPFQQWGNIYEPYRALQRGTIFPELDLPFCGRELV